jgi:UDP-N-acetylglucosamine:LPS N-acetylglucosamine transferase
MQISSAFEGSEHYFVTFRRPNSEELAEKERVYFTECPSRNPLKLALNVMQSLRIFLREKPDVVLSTGADVAVASCLIAKLFGKKVIFIESFCRVNSPSLSGRIIYPFADLFLVQWKENLSFFPKARYAGSVF